MFRLSIFRQLVVPFVLLVSALVGLTTWNAFNSGKRSADALSSNLLKNVLQGTENATREWLISGQALVDSAANVLAKETVSSGNLGAIETYLFSLVTSARRGSYVYIGFADGRYVGVSHNDDGSITALVQRAGESVRSAYTIARPGDRSQPLAARTGTYDARTRPWFTLASAAGKPVWTPVYSSASRRIPEISYATPLRDVKGKIVAVLATDVTLSYLGQFLSRQSLPSGGVSYLTDEDGFLLASSRRGMLIISPNNARIRAIDANDALIRESARTFGLGTKPIAPALAAENIELASSSTPPLRAASSRFDAGTKEFSWVMTVAADEKEFVGYAKDNLLHSAALGGLSVLGAIILASWFAQHLVGDIKRLRAVAERIGTGDLSPTDHFKRDDELGQLSHSINTMREQLAQSKDELEQYAHELEVRVESRTLELTQRNAELQNEVAARSRAQSVADTLSQAVSQAEAAVYIVDQTGTITYANTGATRLSGFEPEHLIGRKYSSLYAKAFAVERRHALDDALNARQRWTGIVSRAGIGGKSYLAEVVLNPIAAANGDINMVCVESDVTLRELDAARMRRAITTDPLTGLGTRGAFNQVIAELNARPSATNFAKARFSLLFLDLDGFKPINDLFGHDAGDEALRTLAGRIRSTLRSEDSAFRFGGDEFVVIAPDGDSEALAHRIHARIKEPLRVNDRLVNVGVSIGVARFPEHGTDIEQLLKLADQAMYESKSTGIGGVTVARVLG